MGGASAGIRVLSTQHTQQVRAYLRKRGGTKRHPPPKSTSDDVTTLDQQSTRSDTEEDECPTLPVSHLTLCQRCCTLRGFLPERAQTWSQFELTQTGLSGPVDGWTGATLVSLCR